MVDYSKKPSRPLSAYAAYAKTFRQNFASDHSNDPHPTNIIDIGSLGRQAWDVLSKADKRAALRSEIKRFNQYDDDLENHVAYMKFMGGCLHENQKTGQFKENWKQLKLEVIALIGKYSVLKDSHIKLVLDATENMRHDMSIDEEEKKDEEDFVSRCSSLRLFLKAKKLDKNLQYLGSKKALQLEEEWDQLRFGEMELLAKRSFLNGEQIRFELNGLKIDVDVDAKQTLGKNELLDEKLMEVQLQEMEVQARKSVLMGDQIKALLSTMKQKLGSEATDDDEQDLEKDDKQDLGVDDNKELSNSIKSLVALGFLTRHDVDYISDHLHWIDITTRKGWDLEWQQLYLEEEQLKAMRLTLKAEQDAAMQVKG